MLTPAADRTARNCTNFREAALRIEFGMDVNGGGKTGQMAAQKSTSFGGVSLFGLRPFPSPGLTFFSGVAHSPGQGWPQATAKRCATSLTVASTAATSREAG